MNQLVGNVYLICLKLFLIYFAKSLVVKKVDVSLRRLRRKADSKENLKGIGC
jgi:hypothetical protein